MTAECQDMVGGRLQRVMPAGPHAIALGLYHRREEWLLLSCHPQYPRAHLMARRPQTEHELPEIVQGLRRFVLDAKVAFIRQRGLDRILEIGLSGEEGPFQIVAELTGRHSNVMLVDPAARLAAAHHWVGPAKSRRPVLPSRPYEVPPFDPQPSLLEASPDDDLSRFEGWSPTLKALLGQGTPLEDIQESIRSGQFHPCLLEGHGPYPLTLPGSHPRERFSIAAEAWYGAQEDRADVEQARSSLSSQLNRVLLAREAAIAELTQAKEAGGRAGQMQLHGELILAYQGAVREGDIELKAWDYEGQEVLIPLLPDKTPLENAQRLFEKAKKAKARLGEVSEQLERLTLDRQAILGLLASLDQAVTKADIENLRDAASQKRWLHKAAAALRKEDRPYEGMPIRELVSPNGWRVLYGTNATSNDYLTTRVAKPNDWWVHVRGAPSAHVVICTGNQPEKVQRADLMFAAEVAVRNSVAKHSGFVLVDYVLKKHVRKPRKSAPGFATYSMEKTLQVEPGSSVK